MGTRVKKDTVTIHFHQSRKSPLSQLGTISEHGGQNRNFKRADPGMHASVDFATPERAGKKRKQNESKYELLHPFRQSFAWAESGIISTFLMKRCFQTTDARPFRRSEHREVWDPCGCTRWSVTSGRASGYGNF